MYKVVYFSYKAVFSRCLDTLMLLLLLLLVAPSHLTLAPSGELREIGQSLAGPCHQAQGLRLCPTVRPSLP